MTPATCRCEACTASRKGKLPDESATQPELFPGATSGQAQEGPQDEHNRDMGDDRPESDHRKAPRGSHIANGSVEFALIDDACSKMEP